MNALNYYRVLLLIILAQRKLQYPFSGQHHPLGLVLLVLGKLLTHTVDGDCPLTVSTIYNERAYTHYESV